MPAPVHPPEAVRAWVERLPEAHDVWVAALPRTPGDPVGFAAWDEQWLDSLYVRPGHRGRGVGSALLDLVRAHRPDGFGLWVFAANEPARAFYARHGLVELEHTDGAANEERTPDVRLVWPGERPLSYLRRCIDEVDDELAVLLARRAALTGAVQDVKAAGGATGGTAGRDPEREAAIVRRMSERVPQLDQEQLTRVVHTVIEESLAAWERRRA